MCQIEGGRWTHGLALSEPSSVWSLFLTDHPYPKVWCLQVRKEIAGKQMLKFGKSSAISLLLCSNPSKVQTPQPQQMSPHPHGGLCRDKDADAELLGLPRD